MLYDEVEVIVMKKSFSTGDIAKLCNVSVRTVQYYDKEGILLIYYHSQVNAYVCSDCYEKFAISFLAYMFSWNGGRKGKYLKCPHCGLKDGIEKLSPSSGN